MPFSSTTGYTFNDSSVRQNAQNRSGVYGLYIAAKWVYVGESNDIQRRLLEHLSETGTCIKRWAPTSFLYELVDAGSRVARQDALIRELDPECNRKLG